jgi:hypothetical protein
MVNNIYGFDDFRGKKKSSIQESKSEDIKDETTKVAESKINEMVDAIDDFYRVSVDVDLPKSLVSTYIKKVKDQTGKDLRADMGEKRLAERLVQWANENYLNIENLPVEIVTGSDKVPAQIQAQSQVQAQPAAEEPAAQEPAQAQAAPVQNTEAQKPAVQVQGQQAAQTAAAQVPAQEI